MYTYVRTLSRPDSLPIGAGRESDGKDCLIGPHAWDHGWSYTSERSPLSCRSFPIGGHSVCRMPPPSVAAFACRPASRSSQSPVASLPPSLASAGSISTFHKPVILSRSTFVGFLIPRDLRLRQSRKVLSLKSHALFSYNF